MKKIEELFNKYKSIILYLFFGACTVLVNIVSYYVSAHIFKIDVMPSTFIAWFVAVVFAYITNRKFVFESKKNKKTEILKEMLSFFYCRIATGLIDFLGMYILVERLHFDDVIIKILINILVIILNYVFSKLIVFSNKDNKNKKISSIEKFIYVSFLVVVFIFLFKSPQHIWINAESGTDSSVFRTIALMMNNGYLPYLNSFDHKGPLIYLYNYIGMIISYSKGVWLIEFASLFITTCYFYKIARLKCNKTVSYIITVLGLTLLFKYFEMGNLVEEYALPFIAVSIYIFLDYLLNKIIDKKRLIICGLSLGAVLMLRPNMISTWIVFCIAVFIDSIRKKNYKELKEFIIYFSIGVLIIFIPTFIWLLCNGLLEEFFKDYILFNISYTASYGDNVPNYIVVFENIVHYFNEKITIAAFLIIIFSIKDDRKSITYLIFMALTLYLACMSGRSYNHYLMIFVPVIIYPFAVLFEYCDKKDKKVTAATILLSIYLLSSVIVPSWLELVKDIPNAFHERRDTHYTETIKEVTDVVTANTDEKDKISVYGNWNIIYVISKRMHATKYSYQIPLIYVKEDIKNEYFEQLKEEKPKLIVIQKTFYDDNIKGFLDENNYQLIFMENEDINESSLIFKLD